MNLEYLLCFHNTFSTKMLLSDWYFSKEIVPRLWQYGLRKVVIEGMLALTCLCPYVLFKARWRVPRPDLPQTHVLG